MAYYAQIVDDLVTEVIAINDDIAGKNYAGIGYTYDAVNQNFIAPQPYPSWILDSNDIWQPPVPQPPAPPQTYWDEETQTWQIFVQP